MTLTHALDPSAISRGLSNSMKNIKLDSTLSDEQARSLTSKYFGDNFCKSQQQATSSYQPYSSQSQYQPQPCQYSQAQAYCYQPVQSQVQPQQIQQNACQPTGYQNVQSQYQAPSYSYYQPIQPQIQNCSYISSNALNAYTNQAQAPIQSGQNLNISTDNNETVKNS